ncbi:hypothetical protein EVAR_96446_1 [Eumeta japonica]|uniref:Uncharacterized protein n=1 Tax=Eumeta variegata TaxID=151549 RepID=A0A4C1VXI2_EUMVA|nr:hypothetical protein EVAR_96446_1 [Eumeta japonica]
MLRRREWGCDEAWHKDEISDRSTCLSTVRPGINSEKLTPACGTKWLSHAVINLATARTQTFSQDTDVKWQFALLASVLSDAAVMMVKNFDNT